MKLRALERPRVPIPVLGDKLTVWYESGGQVAAWRGGVVRLRRDGAEMLGSFDARPPHHADKEKWIEIAEDEWALGSHWCRNPSGAQIVEACAKARGASKAAAAASKAADAAVAAAASLAATATTLIAAATVMAPTGSTVVDTSASPHEMTTMCAVPISYAVALSGRAWPPQFAAGLYELACLHENGPCGLGFIPPIPGALCCRSGRKGHYGDRERRYQPLVPHPSKPLEANEALVECVPPRRVEPAPSYRPHARAARRHPRCGAASSRPMASIGYRRQCQGQPRSQCQRRP